MSLSDLRYLRALGEQRSSDAGTDAQPMDSEPQLVTELHSELEAVQQAWSEEKQHLQSSVESLKKLLAHIQVDGDVCAFCGLPVTEKHILLECTHLRDTE